MNLALTEAQKKGTIDIELCIFFITKCIAAQKRRTYIGLEPVFFIKALSSLFIQACINFDF